MSTKVQVFESAVVGAPCEAVWQYLRPFDTCPPRLTGSQARITNGMPPDAVGCIREIKRPGDVPLIYEKLTALSDEEHLIEYALLTEGVYGMFNYVSTMQLFPVTTTDETFIAWRCTFASDDPHQSVQTISALYKRALANVQKHFEPLK